MREAPTIAANTSIVGVRLQTNFVTPKFTVMQHPVIAKHDYLTTHKAADTAEVGLTIAVVAAPKATAGTNSTKGTLGKVDLGTTVHFHHRNHQKIKIFIANRRILRDKASKVIS